LLSLLATSWSFVSLIGLDRFRPLIRPSAIYEIEFSGGTKHTFDTSKAHEGLVHDVSEAWRADAAALIKAGQRDKADEITTNLAKKSDEVVSTLTARNETRRENAFRALAIAVLPPVCLLAIGVLIGWVAVGFSRS
jgi:hypothetical protein